MKGPLVTADTRTPGSGPDEAPRPTFARRDRKRRASKAPRVPFAVLLVGLVVGGMSLLLVLNTASAANELTRQHYADADTSVAASVQQLRNEVASSAAPSNLAQAAAALGMVPAGNPAFLVVGAGGKVVVRGSAAPASQAAVTVPKKTAPTKSKSTSKSTAAKSSKSAKTKTSKSSKSAKTKTSKSTSKSTAAKSTATSTPASGTHRTTGHTTGATR